MGKINEKFPAQSQYSEFQKSLEGKRVKQKSWLKRKKQKIFFFSCLSKGEEEKHKEGNSISKDIQQVKKNKNPHIPIYFPEKGEKWKKPPDTKGRNRVKTCGKEKKPPGK